MAKPPAPNMEVVQALNDLGSTVNVLEDRYRTKKICGILESDGFRAEKGSNATFK
jgi:hypothetical protein